MKADAVRILIIGAKGQVGNTLISELAAFGEIIAADRSLIDFALPETFDRLLNAIQPDFIVNAAAYTAVDNAETDAELAFKINAEAVGVLGEWAARRNMPLIHFSTDYVFDGEASAPYKEDDAVNPLSVYGKSKALGEALLMRSGAPHLTIRTAWVYSATGKNFLSTILRLAREKEELRIVEDQIGAPTSARQIALFVAKIIGERKGTLNMCFRQTPPLVHFTASGETSWYGFANAIVDGLRNRGVELRVKTVTPIPSSQYPTPAKRPRNSRLSIQRARETFGAAPEDWQMALQYELDRVAL